MPRAAPVIRTTLPSTFLVPLSSENGLATVPSWDVERRSRRHRTLTYPQ
jgi:hypothetical protein